MINKRVFILKNTKGQSVVEFALIFPILLILLFGIVEFGRILHSDLVLKHSAREGARIVSIYATIKDDIEDRVEDGVVNSSPSLNHKKLDVNIDYMDNEEDISRGDNIVINLDYEIEFITPILSFIPNIEDSLVLNEQKVMRVE